MDVGGDPAVREDPGALRFLDGGELVGAGRDSKV